MGTIVPTQYIMSTRYGTLDRMLSGSRSRTKRRIALALCTAVFLVTVLVCLLALPPRPAQLAIESFPPTSPKPPHALAINITKIHVVWDKPQSNDIVLYYLIKVHGNHTETIRVDADELDIRLDSLQAGKMYCVSIAACNQAGCGYFSREACFNTLPPKVPQMIGKIALMETGLGYATVCIWLY